MAIERRLTEIVGAVGGTPAHRALTQRPGRSPIWPCTRASARERRGRRSRELMAVLLERAEEHSRLADAGLHASAARPARVPGPPSAGLFLDARARSRSASLFAERAGGEPAAWRGRAGWCQLRHRPRRWSPRELGFDGGRPQLDRCRLRPRLRPRLPRCGGHLLPPISHAWAPSWCCGRAPSSASASCPMPGARARRSCPRRRTPTPPSCCAPRRRASSPT